MKLSRYIIGQFGNIFDKKRGKNQKLHENEDGYLCCTLLLDNNKRKTFKVHRLVALKHWEFYEKQ